MAWKGPPDCNLRNDGASVLCRQRMVARAEWPCMALRNMLGGIGGDQQSSTMGNECDVATGDWMRTWRGGEMKGKTRAKCNNPLAPSPESLMTSEMKIPG